jgi:hypothetical protein
MKTRLSRIFLILLIGFLAVSGLFGGSALLLDPSGEVLQMPLQILKSTPFNNFLLPGLILFFLFGLLPALLIFPLILKVEWKGVGFCNIYKTMHWAWTYSLYTGIMLAIWIDVQIILLGYSNIIQAVYAFLSILIIIAALLPTNVEFYTLKKEKPLY